MKELVKTFGYREKQGVIVEKEAFSDNQNKILYSIIRKEDNHLISSYDVSFTDTGIWINDDLETGSDKSRVFIPWHNILQINEYSG